MKDRLVFLLCVLPCLPLAAQQGATGVEVKRTELRGNVSMLATGAGGNLAVCAGDDGVFLVDSEFARLAGQVNDAITTLSAKGVRYVFNTHWHFDHVGGNEFFAGKGAAIVAHENVRKHMAAGLFMKEFGRAVPPSPNKALPVITFTDTVSFRINGEEIHAFHLPNAHTDGDGVVHFRKANVVHTGDIVFFPGYPFIDLSAGGSIDGMIAAVKKIAKICDDQTKIIPGHGPLMDKADLESYGAMLAEFRGIIAKEMAGGKDLDAILEAKSTADLDAKWGGMFPPARFTELVFRSLEKK